MTREFIKCATDDDVALIPQTTAEYIQQCGQIDPEQLQRLMYPKALDSNQEEWLRWHERLNHIPYSQMKVLAKEKILPSTLNNIKALPLCPSCTFGGSKKKAWRTKDSFGSIKKSSHNVPGSLVCVYQLISS